MIYEYLIFNAAVLVGPIAFSFESKVRYVSRWGTVTLAAVSAAIPFLIWDAAVTGNHWWFNESYTMKPLFGELPPGEILFFLTVPFACLFIWEILKTKRTDVITGKLTALYPTLYAIGLFGGLLVYTSPMDYTGLALIALGVVALIDNLSGIRLLLKRMTRRYLAIVTGLILVFNGYLTARPLVIYNSEALTGLRIFTIPVEDFLYGYSLLLLSTILYELYLGGRHE